MPPVKYPTEYEPRILEKDIALQGFLDPSIKLVFMDATAGFTDNVSLFFSFPLLSCFHHYRKE